MYESILKKVITSKYYSILKPGITYFYSRNNDLQIMKYQQKMSDISTKTFHVIKTISI